MATSAILFLLWISSQICLAEPEPICWWLECVKEHCQRTPGSLALQHLRYVNRDRWVSVGSRCKENGFQKAAARE